MKKLLITVAALALFTGAASAKTLKTGYPICFTEKSFDELVTAIVNKDTRQINYDGRHPYLHLVNRHRGLRHRQYRFHAGSYVAAWGSLLAHDATDRVDCHTADAGRLRHAAWHPAMTLAAQTMVQPF